MFCGVGGLTYGLRQAGITGRGRRPRSRVRVPVHEEQRRPVPPSDVRKLTGTDLAKFYPKGAIRLLAGCAPCRPFSPSGYGAGTARNRTHEDWGLLEEFSRLVTELKPELVTMENVPALASKQMFRAFVRH